MLNEPKFIKYPEIPHLMETPEILDGNNLSIFEKLDGGNSQIRVHEGRIFTGSRSNFLNREENFRFGWFKDFNNWAKSNHSFYKLPENIVLYGEFMAPHTIPYNPEFVNKFFFIDAYDLHSKKFVNYELARRTIEENFELEQILFLDPIKKGKLSIKEAKELATGKSKYSSDRIEGIVIKDYEKQKFAKFWRTSANPTKEGLIEEINKTILSLKVTGYYPQNKEPLNSENYLEFATLSPDHLSSLVYTELMRSGRKNLSLAEISDTIKKVASKI